MIATVVNRILLVLGYAGVFVAGVLSLAELMHKDVPCGASTGCAAVAADPSSHLLGFPNAYIGFFGYVVLAGLATYRELAGIGGPKGRLSINIGYACAAIGTIASIYLTFISITVIQQTCKWCLTSAAIMTVTLFLYMLLTLKADSAPTGPARGLAGFIMVPVLAVAAVGGILSEVAYFKTPREIISPHTADDDAKLVPKEAHVKNPQGYAVTVVEFGDLDCPVCKREYPLLQQAVAKSNGKLRLVFHNFPLWTNPEHKGALAGAVVAEMAAEQGKFWDYLDTVYGNGVSDPNAPFPAAQDFINFGEHIGLKPDEVRKRLLDEKDPAFLKVNDDLELSRQYRIASTPTFIIMADKHKNVTVTGGDVFTELDTEPYKSLLNPK